MKSAKKINEELDVRDFKNIPYGHIVQAIETGIGLTTDLFSQYIGTVNEQSIFELSKEEIHILEFLRSEGRKISLVLKLKKVNPKTGTTVEVLTPESKITADLLDYKYTPYQYVVSIC